MSKIFLNALTNAYKKVDKIYLEKAMQESKENFIPGVEEIASDAKDVFTSTVLSPDSIKRDMFKLNQSNLERLDIIHKKNRNFILGLQAQDAFEKLNK